MKKIGLLTVIFSSSTISLKRPWGRSLSERSAAERLFLSSAEHIETSTSTSIGVVSELSEVVRIPQRSSFWIDSSHFLFPYILSYDCLECLLVARRESLFTRYTIEFIQHLLELLRMSSEHVRGEFIGPIRVAELATRAMAQFWEIYMIFAFHVVLTVTALSQKMRKNFPSSISFCIHEMKVKLKRLEHSYCAYIFSGLVGFARILTENEWGLLAFGSATYSSQDGHSGFVPSVLQNDATATIKYTKWRNDKLRHLNSTN